MNESMIPVIVHACGCLTIDAEASVNVATTTCPEHPDAGNDRWELMPTREFVSLPRQGQHVSRLSQPETP